MIYRVITLSGPQRSAFAHRALDVCRGFPDRNTQSGVGGAIYSFCGQFAMLLEGEFAAVERLVARIQREVPEAALSVRATQQCEDRAYSSWALREVSLDAASASDPRRAQKAMDLLIDLIAADPAAADAEDDIASGSLIDEAAAPAEAVSSETDQASLQGAAPAERRLEAKTPEELFAAVAWLGEQLDEVVREVPVLEIAA